MPKTVPSKKTLPAKPAPVIPAVVSGQTVWLTCLPIHCLDGQVRNSNPKVFATEAAAQADAAHLNKGRSPGSQFVVFDMKVD